MPEPIYTWTFQSSKPRAGGKLITYLTQLGDDGKLSCDCPGWIFKKKSVKRDCKHTRSIESESNDIYKAWKNGDILPEFEEVSTDTAKELAGVDKVTAKGPSVEYNRALDLD